MSWHSGCITTAETVLISSQSKSEFYRGVADSSIKMVVVTISPQTRASLAVKFGMSQKDTFMALANVFTQMFRCNIVMDATASRDVTFLEVARDFTSRLLSNDAKRKVLVDAGYQPSDVASEMLTGLPPSSSPLPCIVSSCPGWVVYCEKTQGAKILPYLSSARSEQSVMGTVIKRFLAPKYSLKYVMALESIM